MEEKARLKGFLEFLKERVGFTFDLKNFDHRIKLQKYVFLAKEFGWGHNYRYNIYVRGPYSRSLADDYYSLEEVDLDLIPTMDFESFRSLVINKDTSWLEVAATLISIHKRYRHYYNGRELENEVISRTFELKNTISEDIICNAFKELKDKGLLNSVGT